MKILLVEDSATLRYAISRYITEVGHEAVLAQDGEEAMHIVDATAVDMIIMDVEMPGLDGFETTRLIREMLGEHWVPIIFVTGKSEEGDFQDGIEAGGDDYLIKPISRIILKAKIKAMERILDMRNQLNLANRELTELSERDSLTRLYNRRTFENRALGYWRQANRAREPLSVLLLDIDHFKTFNDTYGHIAGDDCIRSVADAIAQSANRPGDIVARYGGEEFVVLLTNTPESGARHVAEQIRLAVASLQIAHKNSNASEFVTLCVGGATLNNTHNGDLSSLIHAADQGLYRAKGAGRNCVSVKQFTPLPKLLLLDKHAHTKPLIERQLLSHCTLINVDSYTDALSATQQQRPDIVVIDDDDIHEALNFCKNLSELDAVRVPVILVTADDGSSAQSPFDQLVILPKPLDSRSLLANINRFLV
ncbi:GGDEF domain-containing response regulator [Marinagarivorans algicola]|uniref:GGDEF domain-containing response regulator n=1 Tax=Marinagarivorans algicola TaxID=1513270 RepID=UPI0037362136